MNRREFLQRVPGYAAVPALLTLPSAAKAIPARTVKPWMRELEQRVKRLAASDWPCHEGLPYSSWAYVAIPSGYPPAWWMKAVGCVNAMPVDWAQRGCIRLAEWTAGAHDGTLLFEVRPLSFNMGVDRFGRVHEFRGRDGSLLHPEIDFYSL